MNPEISDYIIVDNADDLEHRPVYEFYVSNGRYDTIDFSYISQHDIAGILEVIDDYMGIRWMKFIDIKHDTVTTRVYNTMHVTEEALIFDYEGYKDQQQENIQLNKRIDYLWIFFCAILYGLHLTR
ncbi:hypothetical protein D3C87_888340 [compost metagenome]